MHEKERDRILRDLITGLTISAVQHGNAKDGDPKHSSKEIAVLAKLWKKREAMRSGLPSKNQEAAVGFLADRQTIWCRRKALAALLAIDDTDLDVFYERHSLYRRLRKGWEERQTPASATPSAVAPRRPSQMVG